MESKLINVEEFIEVGKTKTSEKLIKDRKNPVLCEKKVRLSQEEYNKFMTRCIEMWEITESEITKEELIHKIEMEAKWSLHHIILSYGKIDFPEECYLSLLDDIIKKYEITENY